MALTLESSSNSCALLWGVALLFSVLAHMVLLQANPNVLAGSGGRFLERSPRIRPDVQVIPPQPETLKNELPRLLERVSPETTSAQVSVPSELPSEELLVQPEDPTVLPEFKPVHAPAGLASSQLDPTLPSDWSPREEVLAITDRRVRETLEVLPRTFRAVETTRPGAPDLTLPTLEPDLSFSELPSEPRPSYPVTTPPGGGGAGGIFVGGPAVTSGGFRSNLVPEPLEFEPPPSFAEEELIPTEDLLRLSLRVYDPPSEPNARYFKLQLMRNGIESLSPLPRDIVFLIDCSASMTEEKLQLGLEGIRTSLQTIEDPDRIQVIAFRDQVEFFASTPVPATVFGKAQVRTFLSTLHARGQTDVFASLEGLNQIPSEDDRPVLAFVITDGVPTQGVMDTGEILEGFAQKNEGRISVFGIGGGDRVNHRLLDFLSFRNRGFSMISPTARGLPLVLPRVTTELRRPVLTDLDVQFTGETSPEVYPKSLSHLYVDRPWILIGRTERTTDRLAFQVIGTSLDGVHDVVFEVNLDESIHAGEELRREWAWQAGLERWADAIFQGTPQAYEAAKRFFKQYGLTIPDAYQN